MTPVVTAAGAGGCRRRPRPGASGGGGSTRLRLPCGLLLGALLVPGWALASGGETAPDPRAQAETLARENEILRKRVELATGDIFYLLLDPAAGNIKLMLKGAVLQDYPVQGLEVGEPRVAFVGKGLPAGWEGRIWSKGALDPGRPQDRIEVDVPPPGQEEETKPAVIPPTPEEKFPVPPRYRIKYEGGLSLEVRPREMDEKMGSWERLRAAWKVWWNDAVTVAGKEPEDTIRLRMVLKPEDADSLYRALPPETRLLILPPA